EHWNPETDVYHQKPKGALPVRWMAPECVQLQVFPFKSDAWAFRMLLWDIRHFGLDAPPRPGCSRGDPPRARRSRYDATDRLQLGAVPL
ncbi:hypothetical protein ISCGN_006191, partial [Ixodes scapularis]